MGSRKVRKVRQGKLFGRKRGPKLGSRRFGSGVCHVPRKPLASRHPVMVTSRIRHVPSLRSRKLFAVVRGAIAAGAVRPRFRLIHFSVQSNHLHLICEGADREALSRGLQGLFIRIAKALNRALGRRGRVFSDRYHDRILSTPSQVRNAIAYVLNNARKHARQAGRTITRLWVDPFSSAAGFYGAAAPLSYLPTAHTWLLRTGWRRAGPVSMTEVPGGADR